MAGRGSGGLTPDYHHFNVFPPTAGNGSEVGGARPCGGGGLGGARIPPQVHVL
jgi:hypothetical protein